VPGTARTGTAKRNPLREQWQKLIEKQVAGLPLMFWIVVGIVALAAIGLGVSLLLKSS